jgi:hypothetical protein
MNVAGKAGAALALLWWAAGGYAEDGWSPVATPPHVIASTPHASPRSSGEQKSAVSLGAPIAVEVPSVPAITVSVPPRVPDNSVTPVAYSSPIASTPRTVRMQAPDPPPPGSGPIAPPGSGVPPPGDGFNNPPADPAAHGFWDRCKDLFANDAPCNGKCWLESDPCFNNFASPITSPFLLEDPRSLTEVRPIFIWQTTPSQNPAFRGGSLEFFGTQARVSLSERWSIVMNKLGFITTQPDSNALGFGNETGFGEFWIGPKWTFLRNDSTQTVAALGVTFQLPIGNKSVFQNTGNLSVAPYLSFAQNFWRTSFGSFNFMDTTGYTFADNQRSEFFYKSMHLDYDVANWNKIYPMLELHWQHYVKKGDATNFGFEGGDLINFGSRNLSSRDILSLALGTRYKFSERAQVGVATEWQLNNSKNLQDFRLTLDFIWRW